jgi:hypothetical protein
MKTLSAVLLLVVLGAAAHAANETAIIAAMRLSERPNYTWTTTVADDVQTYHIEGKTADGLTWQRQPMPKEIARRLGRSAGRELESLFHGPRRYVVQTEEGWKLPAELPKRHPDWAGDSDYVYVTMPGAPALRTADMPADERDLEVFGTTTAVYHAIVPKGKEPKAQSNVQFALALPHEELGVVVASHAALQMRGNVVEGTLTDAGAQLLLVREENGAITPVTAAGRFKLWLAGGRVSKYQLELAGVLLVDRDPVHVRQTTTTEIKDVDTTRLEIPEPALRRLQVGMK